MRPVPLLLLGLPAFAAPPDPFPPDAPLALEVYVAAVLERGPAARAPRAEAEAAAAGPAAARALPDPVVDLMVAPGMIGEGHGSWAWALRQDLPPRGERAAAGAVAAAARDGAAAQAELRLDGLRRAAVEAWARLWAIERGLEAADAHLRLLTELEGQARAAWTAGEAGAADALEIELERVRQEMEQIGMRAEQAEARAALSALLGGPPDAALPPLAPPPAPAPEAAPPARPAPAARAAAAAQDLAAAELTMARQAWRPMGMLALEYNPMLSEHAPWMLGGGLRLPLEQRAREAGVDRAMAMVQAAAAEAEATAAEIAAMQHGARAAAGAARAQEALACGRALTLSRALLQAALDQQAAAGADAGPALRAARGQRDAELACAAATAARLGREAELQRALGGAR
jgi:outer membrane protein TolC